MVTITQTRYVVATGYADTPKTVLSYPTRDDASAALTRIANAARLSAGANHTERHGNTLEITSEYNPEGVRYQITTARTVAQEVTETLF